MITDATLEREIPRYLRNQVTEIQRVEAYQDTYNRNWTGEKFEYLSDDRTDMMLRSIEKNVSGNAVTSIDNEKVKDKRSEESKVEFIDGEVESIENGIASVIFVGGNEENIERRFPEDLLLHAKANYDGAQIRLRVESKGSTVSTTILNISNDDEGKEKNEEVAESIFKKLSTRLGRHI